MAYISTNMSLRVWDLDTDPYDHTELAANFQKIDAHDHTAGKGAQIPPGGIADDAIGSAQLADNSVATNHIINKTILGEDIADGTITPQLFASSVELGAPLGAVIPWWRANTGVAIPANWELCDGRNWSAVTNDLGLSAGQMPDFRNRFLLGAGSGVTENTTGGAHSRSLAHTHAVDAHVHTIPNHSHSISTDGSHRHWFPQLNNASADTSLIARRITTSGALDVVVSNTSAFGLQALFIPNVDTPPQTIIDMKFAGDHSHGGATGSGGSGSTNAAGSSTQPSLSSAQDFRPAYYGLLFLMKVRNG